MYQSAFGLALPDPSKVGSLVLPVQSPLLLEAPSGLYALLLPGSQADMRFLSAKLRHCGHRDQARKTRVTRNGGIGDVGVSASPRAA